MKGRYVPCAAAPWQDRSKTGCNWSGRCLALVFSLQQCNLPNLFIPSTLLEKEANLCMDGTEVHFFSVASRWQSCLDVRTKNGGTGFPRL